MEHVVAEEVVVETVEGEIMGIVAVEAMVEAVTVVITMEVEVLDLGGLLLVEVAEVEAMSTVTVGEGAEVTEIMVGSKTVEAVVETVTVDTVVQVTVETGVTVSVSETVMGEHVEKD